MRGEFILTKIFVCPQEAVEIGYKDIYEFIKGQYVSELASFKRDIFVVSIWGKNPNPFKGGELVKIRNIKCPLVLDEGAEFKSTWSSIKIVESFDPGNHHYYYKFLIVFN